MEEFLRCSLIMRAVKAVSNTHGARGREAVSTATARVECNSPTIEVVVSWHMLCSNFCARALGGPEL